MDITISSHVLNTEAGGPAGGIPVVLSKLEEDSFVQVAEDITDADGRVSGWQLSVSQGQVLRMVFATGDWFEDRGQTPFYPQVQVEFVPADPGHYHIPLLLNRHGYTTYRGS